MTARRTYPRPWHAELIGKGQNVAVCDATGAAIAHVYTYPLTYCGTAQTSIEDARRVAAWMCRLPELIDHAHATGWVDPDAIRPADEPKPSAKPGGASRQVTEAAGMAPTDPAERRA